MPLPDSLVDTIGRAGHVCVLTGAGISAESGVPTFREAQSGLWAEYDPLKLATPDAFERDPALVWRWYRWRRALVEGVEPNAGHRALVGLARRVPRLTLVTQNVDGLHQRAGSEAVVEFHGNLFAERCSDCEQPASDPSVSELPRCPACGGLLRPGVVWFGESIPATALETAVAAAANCDVFLSVGTSSLVYPAAGLIHAAREVGAVCVEINPNPTGQARTSDFALAAKSGELLPELIKALDARPMNTIAEKR